jgi:hypothetical protein
MSSLRGLRAGRPDITYLLVSGALATLPLLFAVDGAAVSTIAYELGIASLFGFLAFVDLSEADRKRAFAGLTLALAAYYLWVIYA